MERDAHYAAVGIATVALLAALAVFTIWLARLQFNSDYDLYDIVFYGPVNGLSEGGEVHFNG
ncbi:MAG: MCE family protein, partial [Pseudomonadota bacterium]|nr:MCE family protein [Pseudomonadota bacterium]